MPSLSKTRIRISGTVVEQVLVFMSERIRATQVRDLFENLRGRNGRLVGPTELHKAVSRLYTFGLIEPAILAEARKVRPHDGAHFRPDHRRTPIAYRLTPIGILAGDCEKVSHALLAATRRRDIHRIVNKFRRRMHRLLLSESGSRQDRSCRTTAALRTVARVKSAHRYGDQQHSEVLVHAFYEDGRISARNL